MYMVDQVLLAHYHFRAKLNRDTIYHSINLNITWVDLIRWLGTRGKLLLKILIETLSARL